MSRRQAVLALVLVCLVWGVSFTAIKSALATLILTAVAAPALEPAEPALVTQPLHSRDRLHT